MKKAVLVVLVLVIGLFFLIFDVSIGDTTELTFIDDFKTETGHDDFLVEQILSSEADENGIRVTLYKCDIDSANFNDFKPLSKKIAAAVNKRLNVNLDYSNIIIVLEPENVQGIKISKFLTVNDLTVSYRSAELD